METWKRNLYVIWIAELLAIAGFSVAFPFLPYFIQNLGVSGAGQVELWSGIIIAVQGVTMTVFSPVWGGMADRYGRKLMVERATFGGALVLGAMGLVQNVEQLALLRALQGVLTGTVAAATTLVASSTPRERAGYALGLLQMAVWIGASVGPLLGGLVADAWGYRAVFYVTGALLFLAGITVWRFVIEDFHPPPRKDASEKSSFWEGFGLVLRTRSLVSLLLVRIIGRLGTSLITPILPLFIQSIAPAGARVASLNGLISGVAAATSAMSAVVLGRVADRVGYRPVLLLATLTTAALYVPHYFVTGPWQLLLLQGAAGFTMGGLWTAVSAALAAFSPEGRQGAVYGLEASAVSAASSVAPLMGAAVAASMGLRLPFLLTAASLAIAAVLVAVMIPTSHRKRNPARKTAG